MRNRIWHYGKYEDGAPYPQTHTYIQTTMKGTPVLVEIPKTLNQIQTIESALAYILGGRNNLQRTSGFKDDNGKFHRWSFSTRVGMVGYNYFFDSKQEVINWAKRLILQKELFSLTKEKLPSAIYLLQASWATKDKYPLKQYIYSLRNEGIITKEFASAAIEIL